MSKTKVEKHFDEVSKDYDYFKKKSKYYYDNLKKLLCKLIPSNNHVLEIGCGTGDLLASVTPSKGYGMDISSKMVEIATAKYKNNKHLYFSTVWPTKTFDYIFMSDVIEHLEKPLETFKKVPKLMNKDSKFIITMANPVWEPILMFWEDMGWKMPEGPHYRIKNNELRTVMGKTGLKIVKHDYKLLIPVRIPIITDFANKYLEKPLRKFAFIEYFVAIKV